MSEEKSELINKILSTRDQFVNDTSTKIRCMVIGVLEEGSEYPIVVFHGDQLEYTALSVAVAKELRRRILDQIGTV